MMRIAAAGSRRCALCTAAIAETRVAYFPVPAGAHPHDVAAAPDGTVWYTAQQQGALGILDPRTGKVEQVRLGPRRVAAWRDRRAGRRGLGHRERAERDRARRSEEQGGEAVRAAEGLREREPQHRDLRQEPACSGSPARTASTAASIRRAGKVDAWKAPKGYGPYGIATTPSGEVWYASLAGDYIARIDTATGAATVVDPPKPGVGPRRIWSDSKGLLWVSFWHAGELARYDPAAKTWKTYALPKSRSGCYSVYVDDKDKVWVTDFVANAILRFDPATEKFESFPSNKRGAAVRQMLGRAGEVWGAESGTDRLVVLRY